MDSKYEKVHFRYPVDDIEQKGKAILTLIDCIKENNPHLYKAFKEQYPTEYLECLREEKVFIDEIEFMNQQQNILFLQDVRDVASYLYNYYIGLASEVILRNIILAGRYYCVRAGGDKDFTLGMVSTEPDLYLPYNNKYIEIKTSSFVNGRYSALIKEKQLKYYKEKDCVILYMDYISLPGKIFLTYVNAKDIPGSSSILVNEKECIKVDFSENVFYELDFTTPSSNKLIASSYRINSKGFLNQHRLFPFNFFYMNKFLIAERDLAYKQLN